MTKLQEVVEVVVADRLAALPKLTDRSQRTSLEMRWVVGLVEEVESCRGA